MVLPDNPEAAQAVGAPIAAAVTVWAMAPARISLPHYGAVPGAPDPRSGMRMRTFAPMRPLILGARSRLPVDSVLGYLPGPGSLLRVGRILGTVRGHLAVIETFVRQDVAA